MKKATIKRRKRVIPSNQEDEGEEADVVMETRSHETTPERGTLNEDGSVNLGIRRKPEPMPMDLDSPRSQAKQPSPLPTPLLPASDLAAYRQSSGSSQNIHAPLNTENRLPPLTSMTAGSERQTSLSPSSFISANRKRSFSATDSAPAMGPEGGYDSSKRVSSIRDILNPASSSNDGRSERSEYSLPPLRSPGLDIASSSRGSGRSGYSSRDGTPSYQTHERDSMKAERKQILEREAEAIRKMLADKEQELYKLRGV